MIPTDGAEGFIGWHTVVQVGGIEGKCGGQLAGGRAGKLSSAVVFYAYPLKNRIG